MTPKFAASVDPIFLYVIGVLERISRNEPVSAAEVRDRIESRFRQADAALAERPHHESWEQVKYALAAWIDEVLIAAPWSGSEWWENNLLEFAYFNTRDRGTDFYKRAAAASQLTRRDALEVFYVCVVLGFRGLYALPEAAFLAEQLGLPTDLESWAQRTAKSIELGQGRPPIYPAPRPGEGAPPLDGKYVMLGSSLMTAILAVCAAVIGYYVLFAGGSAAP
jgi:type VI secretion system protein ImpK